MIDVVHQIDAVRRHVGTRTLEASEARATTIAQVYDASVAEVWDACTNPERIPRWFLAVSGDLRLHGRYQLEGNAGGTIERCDPPNGFTVTWEYGGDVSWIEVRVLAEPGGELDGGRPRTRFELEHIAVVAEERWTEFGPGATGVGWDLGLLGLARHLEAGLSVDPKAALAWSASAEGQQFVTLSSIRWYDASVAAGTDPVAALAAAERTTAAYTGGL